MGSGHRHGIRPNRVLTPVSPGKRYDPGGSYVRRRVPELSSVNGPAPHEPWKRGTRAAADPSGRRTVRGAGAVRSRAQWHDPLRATKCPTAGARVPAVGPAGASPWSDHGTPGAAGTVPAHPSAAAPGSANRAPRTRPRPGPSVVGPNHVARATAWAARRPAGPAPATCHHGCHRTHAAHRRVRLRASGETAFFPRFLPGARSTRPWHPPRHGPGGGCHQATGSSRWLRNWRPGSPLWRSIVSTTPGTDSSTVSSARGPPSPVRTWPGQMSSSVCAASAYRAA